MRLERLTLQNFRGFESLEITFDPSFTVILGGNMAGKTAVLDAAAIALSKVTSALFTAKKIQPGDSRKRTIEIAAVPNLQVVGPTLIKASASFEGLSLPPTLHWKIGVPTVGAEYLEDMISPAVSRTDSILSLPLLAYYGTRRGWPAAVQAEDIRGVGSRIDGYNASFNARPAHATLLGWMRKQTLVELQKGNGYAQPQLAAVVAAVTRCIEDLRRFWFDVQYDELLVERVSHGRASR